MSRKKSFFTLILGGPQRIRRIRGKLSQAEFGKIIGVTQGTIHKYEKGIIFPDEEILRKIADFGKVGVEWIVHGEKLEEHALLQFESRLPEQLEVPLLAEVIARVEEVLTERRRFKLTPVHKARLIARVYDHCRGRSENPDHTLVEKYLLLSD